MKFFCEKSKEIANEIKAKMELISRIETLYFKLFPNRPCDLRKFVEGEKAEKPVENTNRLKEI